MLDAQSQGPQCTACGSPMKLATIEHVGAKTCERFLALDAREFSATSSTDRSRRCGRRQDNKAVLIFGVGPAERIAWFALPVMLPVIERGQSMDGTLA
jgi:hypothetical protein